MKINRVLVLLPFIFLVGCPSTPICVKAVDVHSSNLVLNFSQGQNCDSPTLISSIKVVRARDKLDLWEIYIPANRRGTKGIQISSIVYGIVPKGFSGTPPIPLSSRNRIIVFVEGIIYSTSTSTVNSGTSLELKIVD
jgi:hypothetical protein